MSARRFTATVVTAALSTGALAITIAPAFTQTPVETGAVKDELTLPTDESFRPPSNPQRQGGHVSTTGTRAFQPPSNPRRRDGYTTTTGTRQGSCVGDSETAFTMLAPNETIARTASVRPTFTWYLPPSETSYTVRFRLLAPNEQGVPAPVHTQEFDYVAGINTYELPADADALTEDVDYRWQVVVVCDEAYLSRSLNQERAFEVVSPDSDLQQRLDMLSAPSERALAYGENGFWYDAIALVAQPDNLSSVSLRQELLIDLAALERSDEVLSENLLRLAENSEQ